MPIGPFDEVSQTPRRVSRPMQAHQPVNDQVAPQGRWLHDDQALAACALELRPHKALIFIDFMGKPQAYVGAPLMQLACSNQNTGAFCRIARRQGNCFSICPGLSKRATWPNAPDAVPPIPSSASVQQVLRNHQPFHLQHLHRRNRGDIHQWFR